ncbi:VOC family protein [Candidatus Poriferisodalis sp.]
MGLHHVAYATKDLEATHRFYEELMGFPLVHAQTA